MLYDGFGTSASNLGAGDHGKVAAPTHSSTQKAASHLGRRGRTTCSAQTNALREVPREIRRAPGKAEVYTTVRVGRDFGEREGEPAGSGRASRDAACSGRASRPPRTTRTATQQSVHLTRSPAVRMRGRKCGVRAWGARAWASGVTMQRKGMRSRWGLQGKWHRAGSACSTGQACSAGQACARVRLVCSADQACSVSR